MTTRKFQSILVSGFFVLGFLAACGPSSQDSSSPSANAAPPQSPDEADNNPPSNPGEDNSNSSDRISFSEVNREVFIPRCIECHGASGGVNLESHERVFNEINAIRRVVFEEQRMPPIEEGPLTVEERELLKKWIDQEAP